ncbi:hypothetical protein N7520_007979 [Penicillium odoratum]|uniref:uncharacterized protein n=1 Tax=Penicillium odoratum TaxID=1167516 RepID=UPI002546BE25|nr:uncharacterized protein N7520_007979 [Penicillium odoratum]KAJ5760823.1 hypothetical protein N7520_007979 [Penicillium odoratum]
MFYNFAAPRSIAKRRRVNRACNFCRAQRIRCDANTPCAQCIDHDVSCSRLRSTHATINKRDSRNNDILSLQPASTIASGSRAHASRQNGKETSYPPHPQKSVSVTYQLDSTLEFVTRIDTFCSGVLQLSPQVVSHDDPGPYRSPFCPGEVDPTSSTHCDISFEQIKGLFWVFRTRLHPQIPIISQEDLEISSADEPLPSPLQDAVIAYTMQYIFHSGLHTRLLGLQWKQFEAGKRSRVIGMPYFQRCLAYCTQYAIFATPSLMTLKCFCIMTLFLLDTGQHHTAYSLIGMAVRFARFLNLDRVDPGSGEIENLQIWWTLIHLDVRCSRYSGKPVSEIFSIAASTPYRPPDSVVNEKSSPYYIHCLRLTCATLAVIKALTYRSSPEEADIETRARVLSEQLLPIQEWKENIHKDQSFSHICLDVPDDLTETSSFHEDHENPNSLPIQLTTLLELQYHDILISLHRNFIVLSPPTAPLQHPQADSHAHTALKHALRTIHLIHSRMSQYDVFYGCSELYQYQWNAVITLIGFMLAYSSSVHCKTALRHVDLALQVFEFGGRLSDAAARAAGFTRFLRNRVGKMGLSLGEELHRTGKEMQSLMGSVSEMEGDNRGEGILSYLTTDLSLWSWADFVDPNMAGFE